MNCTAITESRVENKMDARAGDAVGPTNPNSQPSLQKTSTRALAVHHLLLTDRAVPVKPQCAPSGIQSKTWSAHARVTAVSQVASRVTHRPWMRVNPICSQWLGSAGAGRRNYRHAALIEQPSAGTLFRPQVSWMEGKTEAAESSE
jgi:hypothetical protein